MARRAAKSPSPPEAQPFDWLLLALVVILGGSSFAMIRGAVETMPPAAIAVGRLWIGAAVLYVLMRMKGRRFPPVVATTPKGPRLHRVWGSMLAVGAVGNTVPFFIFPFAQRHVESGLAGVYMAFMPIWTLLLAYLFANEPVGPRKIAGFALGFGGVVILMGPEIAAGLASSSFIAQAALLFATLLYAGSAVLSRRAPPVRPRVFAAGLLLCAAILSTPALLFIDIDPESWSLASILSVVGLGVFPTGLAAMVIITLIKRAGAGFMALANYITPLWAVLLGALIYGERLEPRVFVALAVIFLGVFISQRKARQPTVEAGDALAAELEPVVDADTPPPQA